MSNAATLTPEQGFDRLAYTYDSRLANHPLTRLESQVVLSLSPDVTGKTVADIGCGTGRYALQLVRCGASQVIGLDISSEMITVAQRKAKKGDLDDILWVKGDIRTELPLESRSVDVAVCALVLSFLPDVRDVFAEVSRILVPGGTLLISDYHPYGLLRERAVHGAAFLPFMDADGLDYQIPQFPHTVSDLFHIAQEAGFVLDNVAEPAADRQTCLAHITLQHSLGTPIALVLRFTKG